MLRIIQNQNAKSAQQYYSQADYYSEGQELVGQWGGQASKLLGLVGEVDQPSFHRLCENRHPFRNQHLTARTRTDRTVGYDFNFHAPKSVSVLYALTRDERILRAFRGTVMDTMNLIERDAKTRVRKQGTMSERITGKLAWAEFIHFTARPVKGKPDMHLHAHCFTFNCTPDDVEHNWKAVQFRDLKRDAPFYEAAFHAAFAERLRELGYDITRQKKSWEIRGIDPAVINTFSRRTALIEELARHQGIVDPREKGELGTKTREKKAKNLTTDELRVAWSARLTPEQNQQIQDVHQASMEGVVHEPTVTPQEALAHAIAHAFEQQSVVPTRKILETALRFGVGDVSLAGLERELPNSGLILRDWGGQSLATTHEVLAEERKLLDFARQGRGTRRPLHPDWTMQRSWLNAGQQAAVQQLLSSPDRVQLLIGKFGTGKTSLMQETVDAIEATGKTVLTLAPSAEASRGVLRREGFETADTVVRFLVDEKLQHSLKDQDLWIDEAGLLGTKTLAHVFDIAEQQNLRLILSGDWGQHGSVERGSALRLLETDAGLKPAVLKSIVRQQGEYREATMLLAAGKALDGFQALDKLGWVEELPTGEREQRVADEYLASLLKHEKLLIVCPTHAEGEACTSAIRQTLQAAGKLSTKEHEFLQLEPKHLSEAELSDPVSYEPGDILVLMQNAPGYKKGTRLPYSPSLNAQLKKLAPKTQVFRPEKIALAIGDRIRMTAGGHRLNNGTTYTMTGKRLAGLIQLRDHARRVLRSQNEGWPESQRDAARRELNGWYDRFVSQYGPINKTTFSTTADGTNIRRMPNVVKFREDPDAMLVLSLEEYDETTGKAKKAAILEKDVVGPTPAITHVRSAEEGLLVSLNQRGLVDLSFISALYGKPEPAIIAELGDLIYADPATNTWDTADAYLSGNVRQKLAQAEAAGPQFARNADALRAVQPEDVLPGEIDANLGAPWIPAQDIQAFAADLFQVDPASVPVAHLEREAVWSLEARYDAQHSVAATSDYGTPRANGTWLLSLALNMQSPTIYDTLQDGDREVRVVNQEATLAAREKQKQIKEKFRSWVFADPDRTERLVRIYNDAFNNLRPRVFDGSHLDFPGMNQTVQLRPHQTNAVWRGMCAGNTLLAHCVGAGKTFTMAATGMKLKQAGLIKKPMYVVPNHLLEQFSREFLQLYPNAQLLVATKDDLSRDRRKFLTAKIASGEWDGIIVTHSSFERIGMSRDYQEKFLREQIREYDRLLCEHASHRGQHRNLIKTIEKQKAARAQRLKDLLAEDKKDDGLVFDELGVDHVFIDEAHYFKNLECPTKMERVAGIQTGGSERAFDVYMKSQYLHEQHPGHGVTFATGTPISNTMVELYTMQRFLDPEGLQSRGINHFDAWAATFGEVVESMELTPDGAGLRPRSRFARFTNLPGLQQMFRAFVDVQTAEMLNLPRPRLQGNKPTVIACPMSDVQRELQQSLVKRYERIRNERVDPRDDNALNITTDGRKLATDARMIDPGAEDFPGSKINRLVENVFDIWQRTKPTKGTQLLFSDLGVNPTPWGYSPCQDIIHKLVELSRNAATLRLTSGPETEYWKVHGAERLPLSAVRPREPGQILTEAALS